jgi:hypothetical protein
MNEGQVASSKDREQEGEGVRKEVKRITRSPSYLLLYKLGRTMAALYFAVSSKP